MIAEVPAAISNLRVFLIRISVLVGLLVLFLLVATAVPWTVYNIRAGQELAGELTAWRDAGLPLAVDGVMPAPIPEGRNAAPVYTRALEIDFDLSVVDSPSVAGLSEQDMQVITGFVSSADHGTRSSPAMRALLAKPRIALLLHELRNAAEYPQCAFPVKWHENWQAHLPHQRRLRQATELVAANALVLAEQGQVQEALGWCLVGLRIADHTAMEPSLIAQLTATAMRETLLQAIQTIIRDRPVPASTAQALEQHLRAIDLNATYQQALRMEAVQGYAVFTHLRDSPRTVTGLVLGSDEDVPDLLRFYVSPLGLPLRRLDEANYLRATREAINASALPYRQGKAALDTVVPRDPRFHLAVVTPLLLPPLGPAAARRDISQAQIDLCRIALALKQYKAQFDHYPDSLNLLGTDLDWWPPADMLTGGEFSYARQDAGFLIRSPGLKSEDRAIVWKASR